MKPLEIKYQTSSLVPAPHAFAVELSLINTQEGLQYTYDLVFLDRADISAEELEEEGFSEHDDLKMVGKLPQIWAETFTKTLEKTNKLHIAELKEEQPYWLIEEEGTHFYPSNSVIWEQLLDEFKQAILEDNLVEAPLKITVLRIGEEATQTYIIKGEFANRKLSISHSENEKVLNWNELSKLLKDYFAGEMLPDKTSEKQPSKPGLFIDYGDGYWYQLGYSLLTKPSKITSWLER
jgi:hypothetical protein